MISSGEFFVVGNEKTTYTIVFVEQTTRGGIMVREQKKNTQNSMMEPSNGVGLVVFHVKKGEGKATVTHAVIGKRVSSLKDYVLRRGIGHYALALIFDLATGEIFYQIEGTNKDSAPVITDRDYLIYNNVKDYSYSVLENLQKRYKK